MYKISTQSQPEAKYVYLEADEVGTGVYLLIEGYYVLHIDGSGVISPCENVDPDAVGMLVDDNGSVIISTSED